MQSQASLKQVFCASHGCKPEDFPRRVIVACVPWYWRPAVALVLRCRPSILAVELSFVESLGTATQLDEVHARLREYRGDLARAQVQRRAMGWGLRLRTRLAIETARAAWHDASYRTH